MLTAQSLEPASDSLSPSLSLSPPLTLLFLSPFFLLGRSTSKEEEGTDQSNFLKLNSKGKGVHLRFSPTQFLVSESKGKGNLGREIRPQLRGHL